MTVTHADQIEADFEANIAKLTPRERDVARLSAQGFSARYIARRYGISTRTVETHTRHICEKLEIGHRDALIERYAAALRRFPKLPSFDERNPHPCDFDPIPAPRIATGLMTRS